MKIPVVLAKAEGRKKTSVAGVREIGEVSESTGMLNPRGATFPSSRSISRLLSCQCISHMTELQLVTRETILAVDISPSDLARNFEVNTFGVFYCGQAAARAMIALGTKGRIINTASMTGKQGGVPYVASKFAVLGLTQAMAFELAPHGI